MPLNKPDATQLEYLKARIVGLAALHREIAALSQAADLQALLRMGELVDSHLRELHPAVINECQLPRPLRPELAAGRLG